jgi:hypothetical protein
MEKRLTRFSSLHEKRAEVIAELYRLLVEMKSSLSWAAFAVSPRAEEWTEEEIQRTVNAADQSIDAFQHYFERHRIHLPESLVEKIERFCAQTLATSIGILATDIGRTSASQHEFIQQEYHRVLDDISQEVMEQIPSLIEDIEKEFRGLLGS